MSLHRGAGRQRHSRLGQDATAFHHYYTNTLYRSRQICFRDSASRKYQAASSSNEGDGEGQDDDKDYEDITFDIEPLDEEDLAILTEEGKRINLDSMERAWRYAKKPLLSIGSKGATLTHGNSLRQLLEQHTVVKVKVNTRRFDGSLQSAFEHLRSLAEQNGAPAGIEMIQARKGDKIILFGLPGTLERISKDEFPVVVKEKKPRDE